MYYNAMGSATCISYHWTLPLRHLAINYCRGLRCATYEKYYSQLDCRAQCRVYLCVSLQSHRHLRDITNLLTTNSDITGVCIQLKLHPTQLLTVACSVIGAYAWVSGGELPSQRLRSYTFGLAASTTFFVSSLDERCFENRFTDIQNSGLGSQRKSSNVCVRLRIMLHPLRFTAHYFINPDSLNWGPKYGCKILSLIHP